MNTMIPGTNPTNVNPRTATCKKRTHIATHDWRKFNPTLAPPIPPLKNDLVLQVHTHKSLRRSDVSPDKFDDNERLIELGKAVFDLSLTRYLFHRRPMLKGPDLAVRWFDFRVNFRFESYIAELIPATSSIGKNCSQVK